MIQNTYIQSGELVTISGVKKFIKKNVFKSLRFHLIILILLVGLLSGGLVKHVILKSYEKRAVEVRTAEIQNQCTILCDQLGKLGYTMDPAISEVIQSEMNQLSSIYDGRVVAIDSGFRVVKDTYDIDLGKTIVSEDVIRCSRGESTSYYDAKNKYIEVTSPIFDNETDAVKGVLLVSVSTDVIEDSLSILDWSADMAGLIILVLLLVLAIFAGNVIVRPFRKIALSIESVTEGHETDYLKVNTYGETKRISEAFNKMLAKIKVVDDSRNEFVSNVSHELKTPLTSMKVLADSLLLQEDVPAELYKEFMQDMSEEIERENKIINDLLTLVKLDKTADVMNIQSEDINLLVEKILKRLRPIAAKRNIEVVFESYRPVTAEVDETKLSLAISNLVENAIKYNKENGWIHVTLNADHKNFYLEVADSGIGIPEEDIERIFERFYRVDKSHSREIGGTGLGLSIARNTIVMHKGAVKVYSRAGEGTTFTVRIPIVYVS